MSRSLAGPALAGIAFALAGYEIYGFILVHGFLGDYGAFWCAANVMVHGADPYRAAPLWACEHASATWGFYSPPNGVVVPAPIPPYAIAFFVPLALLWFPAAAVLWLFINAGAIVLSGVLMSRVLGIPRLLAAWCLLLPATILWLPYGELTPLALAGAMIAAVGLQTRRNAITAAGLVLLAVEPHLALGAWICVAIFVPGTRAWIAAAGAFLVGISLAAHPTALVEYVRFVLPLHALAEVPRPAQYSATWMAYALGTAPNTAIAIGQASYVVFLIGGICAARVLQRRWSEPAVLVLAPLCAAVIGGVFVHASQVALSLPLAALFAARERGQLRVLGTIALAILAVPWGWQQPVAGLSVIVVGAVVFSLSANRAVALRLACLAALLMVSLLFVQRHNVPIKHAGAFPVAHARGELASAPWGRYIWREQSTVSPASWLSKAPTWFALLLLVCGAAALAKKETVPIVRVDQAPIVP